MRYDYTIASMTWSYSRLQAFETCPYSWMQKYIYHVSDEPKFFTQYGLVMHTLLQRYLTDELPRAMLPAEFLLAWHRDITSPPPNERIGQNYLEQGKTYFRDIQFPERSILDVERKLEFQFAGHPFIGFLDCASADADGKIYITDHKSHALKPRSGRKKPTKADRELDDYLRQLYMYAHAFHEIYGQYPDYLEFNCFRTGTWITEPFREEKLHETEDWAGSLIDTITATEDWLPHEDYWFCHHICGVSEDCEYMEE